MRPGLLALVLVACLARTGWGQTGAVDRTWPAAGDRVSVRAPNASVYVDAWDRDEIRVRKTDAGSRHDLGVSASPDSGLVIDVRHLAPADPELSARDTVFVTIPRRSELSVQTYRGSVGVVGIEGDVRLESFFGRAEYRGDAERVSVAGFHGAARIDSPSATEVVVTTGGGDVVLLTGGGVVRVESVRGDIDVRALRAVGRATIESTSGSIGFEASLSADAEIVLDTHGGDVALRLGPGSGARIELETYRGAIRNDLGPSIPAAGGPVRRSHVEFTVYGGRAIVRASTFLGDIIVRASR